MTAPRADSGSRPLKLNRWAGCEENPVGYHVTVTHNGRELIGTVTGARWQDGPVSGCYLTVNHFNGEPWPTGPDGSVMACLVRVLDRSWPEWKVSR